MNLQFTGENSDRETIIEKIEVLENIALQTVRGKTEYPKAEYLLDYENPLIAKKQTSLQRRHVADSYVTSS
jgi:hypothetical protein